MTRVVDLKFEITEGTIDAILKMMGFDKKTLCKEEVDKELKNYMEQYFFNQPDFTVLEVKISNPQKKIAEFNTG